MSDIGVLLTNLGTPTAPTVKAVRRYLAEFLWDKRVVDIPRPIWWLILNGFILRFRPRRSAHSYQKIWLPDGSPLLVYSKKQAAGLQQRLSDQFKTPIKVVLAMRYNTPSIEQSLLELHNSGVKRLLILPLYPQYSSTTTGSTFDAIAKQFAQWKHIPELRMVNHYADDSAYIDALVQSIQQHWESKQRSQHLLFSFHGIPKRLTKQGDPYESHCRLTTQLIVDKLGLHEKDYSLVFQSRFGKEEWLNPYCDKTLQALPQQGIKSVDVICPGFAADCLETLEEIAIQNQALFKKAGGEQFNYIPALNDSTAHLQVFTDLVIKHIQGWE